MRMTFVSVVLGIAGCGTPTPIQPRLQPRLEQPFTLRPDQDAEFPDLQLVITFRSVSSDSRCPRTVVCVWEGSAEVRLEVTERDSVRWILLNTALEPREAVVGSHRLVLRALSPAPPLRPEDHLVTLELRSQ